MTKIIVTAVSFDHRMNEHRPADRLLGIEVTTNQGTFGGWLRERDLRRNGGVMIDCWRNRDKMAEAMVANRYRVISRPADGAFGKALMKALEGNPLMIDALRAFDVARAAEAWAQQQQRDLAAVVYARIRHAEAMHDLLRQLATPTAEGLDAWEESLAELADQARDLLAAIAAQAAR